MPRVILSKGEAMMVTPAEAHRINEEWQARKPLITINGTVIRRGEIRRVDVAAGFSKRRYNLSDPSDREEILSFGRELRSLESSRMPKPLEWYGRPYADYAKEKGRGDMPGYVFNAMLGLAHWSTVQRCIDTAVFHRGRDGSWAITDVSLEGSYRADIGPFSEFMAKWWALRALRSGAEAAANSDRAAIVDAEHDKLERKIKVDEEKQDLFSE